MVTAERQGWTVNGWIMLTILLPVSVFVGWRLISAIEQELVSGAIAWGITASIVGVLWGGFFTLQPNVTAVFILFGAYSGSIRTPGFKWSSPFYRKLKVSLRWRNLDGATVKVNELRGNPIDISAVVVWRVDDAAKAVFDVEHFETFLSIQSESALRHMAMTYPYDTFEHDTLSLRGSPEEICLALKTEVQERVSKAGILIDEARLKHLAYAPEIAGAMLQRQQADAVVAARTRIVEGAVGMVEMAIDRIEKSGKVALDDERKAAMVSNLLVVLCGHQPAQPIVNAGTLYTG